MIKPKTICIAGTHLLPERTGGVEWQIYFISKALITYGYHVVHLSPSLSGKSGYEKLDNQKCVYWYPHASSFYNINKKLCYAHLEKIKPDLIYLRGRTALQESGIIDRYKRDHNPLFTLGLSSDGELCYHRFTRVWKNGKYLHKKIITSPYALWSDWKMKQTIQTADWIICQHAGQLEKTVLINKNSVTLPSLHYRRYGDINKSDQNIIVWIANNRPDKQSNLFIKLAHALQQLNCKFIMILGNGRSEKSVKPSSNLTILNEMPRNKIDNLLAKAILLLNTSHKNVEGFPNVFIQAWLAETPVVSLHANPAGILTKHQLGFHSRSFSKLVHHVRKLVTDPNLRIKMGRQARAYAEKHHSFDTNWIKVARQFETMLD